MALIFRRWGAPRPGRAAALALLPMIAALAVACGSAAAEGESSPVEPSPDEIVLGISMFLAVDDVDAPNPLISSARPITDLPQILQGVNQIWAPAGIRFELRFFGAAELPRPVITSLLFGDARAFATGPAPDFVLPNTSTVNIIFVRQFGAANGATPFLGSNVAFVIDEPAVHDRRVTSHEIGHMLQLGHVFDDPGRLMFPGTNGMALSAEEIAAARMAARALLEARRP